MISRPEQDVPASRAPAAPAHQVVVDELRTIDPKPLAGIDEATSAGKYSTLVAKMTGITPAVFTFSGM